jgi:hypothetical protein
VSFTLGYNTAYMILSSREVLKYSLILGGIVGILLIAWLPFLDIISPQWMEGRKFAQNEYKDQRLVYLSFTSTNTNQHIINNTIKSIEYLLLPSLLRVEVNQTNDQITVLEKDKVSIWLILLYPIVLIAILLIGWRIKPDRPIRKYT